MKGKIVIEYVRKYWFKATVLSFMLFVLLKKDISFGINFNAPKSNPQEQLQQGGSQPTQHKEERKYFTDESQIAHQENSLMNRLGNFSFTRKKEKENDDEKAEKVNAYLRTHVAIARKESQEFGIPASIILANALIHSNIGTSETVKTSNNHFNLPCTADWKGNVAWGNGACYRAYDEVNISFRDHSLFLTTGANAKLRELGKTDYKSWAKAIQKTAYSSERKLAKQLIRLIETYELQQLDAN